jgi:hypothetical protein
MNENTIKLEFTSESQKLVTDTNRVANQMDEVEKKSSKMGAGLKNGMATAAGAIAGFAAVGIMKMVDLSKSMEAMDVKAKTVFQEQLPMMQAWAEENRKAFGASTRQVVDMAASLADLLKPMGFTSEQAANMSKQILDLSGALSRWTGGKKTAAEVSEILADAMLGETDSLKGLGISIGAADIQARVAAKGQAELTGAALQQAEAIATQELIMEKSTDAQAAWANGGREAAEAQNAATSNLAESTEKLAQIIAPLYEKFVQFLAIAIEWIMQNQEMAIAIGATAAAVWLLNAAMNANPIVIIVTLIGTLVAAFIWLWNNCEGFRNFWTTTWDAISGAVGWAVDFIKGVWDSLVIFFTQTTLGRTIAAIFNTAVNAIGAVADAIGWLIGIVDTAVAALRELFGLESKWSGSGTINSNRRKDATRGIKRNHGGGVVEGMLGSEQIRILQAGERVIPKGQQGGGGGNELRVTGTGALYEAIQLGLRSGEIQLVDSTGQRVRVA